MVDVYQVTYEHTAALSLVLKSSSLKIRWRRHFLEIVPRADGTLRVIDPTVPQRIFTCSGVVTGDDIKDKLDAWMTAAIDYTGAYPRLSAVYLDGDDTLSNVEVAIVDAEATDLGNGKWGATIVFAEKSA